MRPPLQGKWQMSASRAALAQGNDVLEGCMDCSARPTAWSHVALQHHAGLEPQLRLLDMRLQPVDNFCAH